MNVNLARALVVAFLLGMIAFGFAGIGWAATLSGIAAIGVCAEFWRSRARTYYTELHPEG